jgi:hypothetical protein
MICKKEELGKMKIEKMGEKKEEFLEKLRECYSISTKKETLSKVRIICEIHPKKICSLGYNTKNIDALLGQYNYKIYQISEEGLIHKDSISCEREREHYFLSKTAIDCNNMEIKGEKL